MLRIDFLFPAGARPSLAGVMGRLARLQELVSAADLTWQFRTDDAAVRASLGLYSISIVERSGRGVGGDNAALLRRLDGRKSSARSFPLRWELSETLARPDGFIETDVDLLEPYYNFLAWTCDEITRESPDTIVVHHAELDAVRRKQLREKKQASRLRTKT